MAIDEKPNSPVLAVDPSADGGKVASSAIGKAFAILRVLRRASSPVTLTSIAQSVDMAPSSAHSVLNQLLQQGAVLQDQDKRYQLGPQVFYLGSAFARGTRVYRSIWMELVSAANELGVTAALAVPWDNHHLVLNSHRGGSSTVAVPFGGRVPIGAASWGKVYYGWSDDPIPSELQAHTAQSITDAKKFRAAVEQTVAQGYAVDRMEFADGVGGTAAPLTSDNGYEGLASFLAPWERVEQLTLEMLGSRISSLTARASLALGDNERMSYFGAE